MFFDYSFSNLDHKSICKHDIFIVNQHNFVLPIWAYYSIIHNKRYVLVSFDYHTDTRKAFIKYSYTCRNGPDYSPRAVEEFRSMYVASINPKNIEMVIKQTRNLANDEHIRAAMELGYILRPQIIVIDDKHPDFDIDYYRIPEKFDSYLNQLEVKENPYISEYGLITRLLLNRIDDDYISSTNFIIPDQPYILDFDLDYFPTRESLSPQKNEMIKKLICNSQIITIAREKKCFNKCCLQKGFTAEEAERLLLHLIENFLN